MGKAIDVFLLCLDIFRIKRFTNRNNCSRYPNGDRLRLFVLDSKGTGDGVAGGVAGRRERQKKEETGKREQGTARDRRQEVRQTRRDRTVPNGEAQREEKNFALFFLTTLLNLLAHSPFAIFILDREERIADQDVSSSSCAPILIKKNEATPHLHGTTVFQYLIGYKRGDTSIFMKKIANIFRKIFAESRFCLIFALAKQKEIPQ